MITIDPKKKAELDKKRIEEAVQAHLDAIAKARGYDNIMSACSYAPIANPYQAEGIAFLSWRSAVWAHCFQVLSDVQAGKRAVPTVDGLIAELPALAV